jgi:ubiquinone/menaquinone biosynthesis C-methylase UbiE/uncharacterized protein YbaR (Trm112 family)
MREDALEIMRCPNCGGCSLSVQAKTYELNEIVSGAIRCEACDTSFPIVRGIPRFVSSSNYADSFGLQWTKFRRTQLDSFTGVPITARRFYDETGWDAGDIAGKLVLDVGCGSGRFAEVALSANARVIALDYSEAADACRENLQAFGVQVVQGDVARLPFRRESFDYVYCFGVLQHTADVERAFGALPAMVKSGGRLAVDVYPKLLRNMLWPKYWLRPITKRLSSERLLSLVERHISAMLDASDRLGRVPRVGPTLRRIIPVANYRGIYPLPEDLLYSWAVLDTFDMLSPLHDHPQYISTVKRWFERSGMTEVEIFRRGHIVGRGRKPKSQ